MTFDSSTNYTYLAVQNSSNNNVNARLYGKLTNGNLQASCQGGVTESMARLSKHKWIMVFLHYTTAGGGVYMFGAVENGQS